MAAEIRLGMLNYVVLMGRTCADPDLKYTPKGTPVLNFRIAVDRRFKDPASGEWKSDPSFFSVTYFGQYAEKAGETLKKGECRDCRRTSALPKLGVSKRRKTLRRGRLRDPGPESGPAARHRRSPPDRSRA